MSKENKQKKKKVRRFTVIQPDDKFTDKELDELLEDSLDQQTW